MEWPVGYRGKDINTKVCGSRSPKFELCTLPRSDRLSIEGTKSLRGFQLFFRSDLNEKGETTEKGA